MKTVPAERLGPGDRLFIADFAGDGLSDLAGTHAAEALVFVTFNRP